MAEDACVRTSSGGGRRRLLLSSPDDAHHFSEPVCLIRSQIEVFAATPPDVEARARIGGSFRPPNVGRVGLRCVHCAHLPPERRPKGSTSFPRSVRLVFQAVRNWRRNHLPRCHYIPADVRARFEAFNDNKRTRSSKASAERWIESCRALGMVDADDGAGGGIRFEEGVVLPPAVAENVRSISSRTSGASEITGMAKSFAGGTATEDSTASNRWENVTSTAGDVALGDLRFDFPSDFGPSPDFSDPSHLLGQNDPGNIDGAFDKDTSFATATTTAASTPEEASGGIEDGALQYSAEEERKDMASLSTSDMAKLEADLRGLSLGGGTGGSAAFPASSAQEYTPQSSAVQDGLLDWMDDELARLPMAETAAYRAAQLHCPGEVSASRRMRFLEAELEDSPFRTLVELEDVCASSSDGSGSISSRSATCLRERVRTIATAAARRLARHWSLRRDIFGPERCYLPMTLRGAMKDEISNLIERRVVQLLPVLDAAGRAILFMDLTRRNLSAYSAADEVRAVWYLLEVAAEDPRVRRNGHVVLNNTLGIAQSAFDGQARDLSSRAEDVSPMKCRAIHVFNPGPFVHYIAIPIVKRVFGKAMRLRMKSHRGPIENILKDLEQYRLPRDRLPIAIGGDVDFDMKSWIADRLAIEDRTMANVAPPVVTATLSSRTEAYPVSKRRKTPDAAMSMLNVWDHSWSHTGEADSAAPVRPVRKDSFDEAIDEVLGDDGHIVDGGQRDGRIKRD